MKNRLQLLLSLAVIMIAIMLIPQTVLAFTYPKTYWELHPRNSLSFTIPALIIGAGFAMFFYIKLRNTGRDAAQGGLNKANAASMIRKKLLPDEKPVRQISNKFSDFIITDKRLLRFSPRGFQGLEYNNISDVKYIPNSSKKQSLIVCLVVIMLGVFFFTVDIITSAFSPNIMNVYKADAMITALMCAIVFWICILWISADFGYYQIESKVDGFGDSWRIVRQRSQKGNADIDEFIKTMKYYITMKELIQT